MAAKSYSNIRSQNDFQHSIDHGIGSLVSHPYQYETNTNTDNQYQSNLYSQTSKTNPLNNNETKFQQNKNNIDQHLESNNHQQKSSRDVVSNENQSNLVRSERQISNRAYQKQKEQIDKSKLNDKNSKSQISYRSVSNEHDRSSIEKEHKKRHFSTELKPTKSSTMRAAAIKKKEETREKNRQDQFFPSSQNKSREKFQQQTDGEQSDNETKKQSYSHPTNNKKHRYDNQKEYNSDDEDKHKHHQSKSLKSKKISGGKNEKNSHLPLIRQSRLPPYYDPYLDSILPSSHPLRARNPYYDDYHYGYYPPHYDRRHLYEDAGDIPPYLAPYHDAYDPFFDYEKRKVKPKRQDENGTMTGYETERDDGAKSQLSRKSQYKSKEIYGEKYRRDREELVRSRYGPHLYGEPDMLEIWRQERNDYLKKKFKPSIHDVLYSQQWMKSDSYAENQRRRALRDVQGYYFPYKKYTLKDYKDIQKISTQNQYLDGNGTTIDRKERAKKRQEYGLSVERQVVDNPGTRQVPPNDLTPRKPWHISGGEIHDADRSSKRERALEYAKDQVKYRPVNSTLERDYGSDPTDKRLKNHYDDENGSNLEQTIRTNQSYDEYD